MRVKGSALVLVIGCWSGFAIAQEGWTQEAKFGWPDLGVTGDFGRSLDIDGDYAVVGARYFNTNRGTACVFYRDAAGWSLQQQLTYSGVLIGNEFGKSVGISGNRIIVGAQRYPYGSGRGAAYIFERSGTTWTEVARLMDSGGADYDHLGQSVAIDGDYAVLGAPGRGVAVAYHYDGTEWVQQTKLTASDGTSGSYFGNAVAITGDVIVVGAQWQDGPGNESGRAYVYERSGSTWAQTALLRPADLAGGDLFGQTVSISGGIITVSSIADDDAGSASGSAYVYAQEGGTWVQKAKLTAPDAAAGDRFGVHVSVSEGRIAVGSFRDDDVGAESGSVYVFGHDPGDLTSWRQLDKFVAPDGAAGDLFGVTVKMDGMSLVVGTDRETVYFFIPEPGTMALLTAGALSLLWRKRN